MVTEEAPVRPLKAPSWPLLGLSHPAYSLGPHVSPLGPSVSAPATPQQGRSPAPHSPALPGHGPIPIPMEVLDAWGWGCLCPGYPGQGSGTGPGCQALPCHPGISPWPSLHPDRHAIKLPVLFSEPCEGITSHLCYSVWHSAPWWKDNRSKEQAYRAFVNLLQCLLQARATNEFVKSREKEV